MYVFIGNDCPAMDSGQRLFGRVIKHSEYNAISSSGEKATNMDPTAFCMPSKINVIFIIELFCKNINTLCISNSIMENDMQVIINTG